VWYLRHHAEWPNDIVHQGKKTGWNFDRYHREYLKSLANNFGVGLNIKNSDSHTSIIDRPITDISTISPYHIPSRNQLAGLLIKKLIEILPKFQEKD